MTTPTNYRNKIFDVVHVAESGKYMGRNAYWKLYFIENLFRTLIHSVLIVQYPGQPWWTLVANRKLREQVDYIRNGYLNEPSVTSPGKHEIYYLYLKDLNKILFDHSKQFERLIPNLDDWVVWLEAINLPRNLVGHMNWLDPPDRDKIDLTYRRAKTLLKQFKEAGKAPIIIPQ